MHISRMSKPVFAITAIAVVGVIAGLFLEPSIEQAINQSGKRDINHGYYRKLYSKQRWLHWYHSNNDDQCEGKDCHQRKQEE